MGTPLWGCWLLDPDNALLDQICQANSYYHGNHFCRENSMKGCVNVPLGHQFLKEMEAIDILSKNLQRMTIGFLGFSNHLIILRMLRFLNGFSLIS